LPENHDQSDLILLDSISENEVKNDNLVGILKVKKRKKKKKDIK
jgi:hypothetical protein